MLDGCFGPAENMGQGKGQLSMTRHSRGKCFKVCPEELGWVTRLVNAFVGSA